jgi:glycosyltransferase involved in cell wall biosynthesis
MRIAVENGLGVERERVSVVEPAAEEVTPSIGARELQPLRATPSHCRLLYVGNDSNYKNLKLLPGALELLRRQLPELRLFATLRQDHPLARHPGIVALGSLRPEVVAEAYGLATALVMPSLAETVGLPLLEAALAGLPILAADQPYAREVCGEAASYFDALSPVDLAQKALRLLRDTEMRECLIQMGRRGVEKRRAARPYDRMIELLVGVARDSRVQLRKESTQ